MENQNSGEEQIMQQFIAMENVVKQNMTKEALSRYGNIRVAHTDMAIQVVSMIAQALQAGHIKEIDDNTLRGILLEIQKSKKKLRFRS